jgi:putative membrane protein
MEELDVFEIIKILHIASVISWLAGLLYLPRIFVYHASAQRNSDVDKIFQVMEKRLLRYIMNPAMLLAVGFGLVLAYFIGFNFVWLHIKIGLVLCLIFYHHFLAKCRKKFALGKNIYSQKFFRILNEVPTLLMIAIISIVILKPF